MPIVYAAESWCFIVTQQKMTDVYCIRVCVCVHILTQIRLGLYEILFYDFKIIILLYEIMCVFVYLLPTLAHP